MSGKKFDLEALGITRDELVEKAVQRVVDAFFSGYIFVNTEHGDGDDMPATSTELNFEPVARKIREEIEGRVDKVIGSLVGQVVGPSVDKYIEDLLLEETNRWGEKTGRSFTFKEFLVHRAGEYMLEDVDHQGKSKKDARGGIWQKQTNRVTWMVNKHLHYSIENAMKTAIENANVNIVGGLETAIKESLAEIGKRLRVQVKT